MEEFTVCSLWTEENENWELVLYWVKKTGSTCNRYKVADVHSCFKDIMGKQEPFEENACNRWKIIRTLSKLYIMEIFENLVTYTGPRT